MNASHRARGFRLRRIADALVLAWLWGAMLTPRMAHAEDVVVPNWGTNMYGVIYAVGFEKGFFKQGTPVTGVISANGGGAVLRAILANKLPFGELAVSAAMDANVKGIPIIAVGSVARTFDMTWYVKPGSPLKTVKDIVGHKMAYTSPQALTQVFELMVAKGAGIDPGKVGFVAAGGFSQGLTLLDTGGVDVAPLSEPLKTLKAAKYRKLFGAEETLPPMVTTVTVTTRDYAAKHGDVIRAILEARRKSVDYIYAHPDEAAKIMAKAYNMKLAITTRVIDNLVHTKQRYWSSGELDIDEFTPLQKGMLLSGARVAGVNWKQLLDASYLPADLRAESKLP